MRSFARLLLFLAVVSVGATSYADIQGFRVPATMARDEPIDEWTVYRDRDTVFYVLCRASAEECTRETPTKEIAEKRSVPYATWLGELARNYHLEAKVLLAAKASARRIDATVEALKRIVDKDSDATDSERDEARKKLEALTKRDGYKDRFRQAQKLAEAAEPPAPGGQPLVLEATDKRAFNVRWPFNFDFTAVEKTETVWKTADVVTDLEWFLEQKVLSRWVAVDDVCKKHDALVPTAEQAKAAGPWLAVSPLGKGLDADGSKTVGARGKAFWTATRTASSVRVDVGSRTPLIDNGKTKVFHFFEGSFDLFDLGRMEPLQFRPATSVMPKIVSKQSGTTYITFYDVVQDPTSDQVLAQTGAVTPALGVLCVRPRPLEAR